MKNIDYVAAFTLFPINKSHWSCLGKSVQLSIAHLRTSYIIFVSSNSLLQYLSLFSTQFYANLSEFSEKV